MQYWLDLFFFSPSGGPIKVEALNFCGVLAEKWLAHKDVQVSNLAIIHTENEV